MRKLITTHQENIIECDNPECDFVLESPNPEEHFDCKGLINHPCPYCGTNLLTEEDYIMSNKLQ